MTISNPLAGVHPEGLDSDIPEHYLLLARKLPMRVSMWVPESHVTVVTGR